MDANCMIRQDLLVKVFHHPCIRCRFPAVLRSTLEEGKVCIEQLLNMRGLVRRLSRSFEGTFMRQAVLYTEWTHD